MYGFHQYIVEAKFLNFQRKNVYNFSLQYGILSDAYNICGKSTEKRWIFSKYPSKEQADSNLQGKKSFFYIHTHTHTHYSKSDLSLNVLQKNCSSICRFSVLSGNIISRQGIGLEIGGVQELMTVLFQTLSGFQNTVDLKDVGSML